MNDRIFWRVIAVVAVVGLFAVAYGLCKNSPLPSPSFSSFASADDFLPPPSPSVEKVEKCLFESLGVSGPNLIAFRAKVPGGWFVITAYNSNCSSFFYSDPEHKWNGEKME
jgi:hypothetical protein